jgi:hypothetical protein
VSRLLGDLGAVALGALFVIMLLLNGLALVTGWVEILARTFGG